MISPLRNIAIWVIINWVIITPEFIIQHGDYFINHSLHTHGCDYNREHNNTLKGRVRIRKPKSGEKCIEQFVNDAYVVLLYRCLKIIFMQMSDSASWVCTEAWKMGILSIFVEIDEFLRL